MAEQVRLRYAGPPMNPLAEYLPPWLAWPLSALSTVAALAGAVLLFFAAALGEYAPAVWGGVVFVAAGALWYLADMAASNRPID